MNCEDIKLNLPLYADDVLSDSERESIENHLPFCPLCRQALSEFAVLKNEFRGLAVGEMPESVGSAIKTSLRERLDMRPLITVATVGPNSLREKVLHWLMPYSVGTVVASLFTITFLFVLMSELQSSVTVLQTRGQQETSVLLANSNASEIQRELQLPPEFGDVAIATTPPELNPAGALIALTKSIVRGDMNDEEVVVVADVFGNGLARIAEVVEPPNNASAMRELEKAFNTEPDTAPFLPSKLDNNSTAVRVVLKIQRVDVGNYR